MGIPRVQCVRTRDVKAATPSYVQEGVSERFVLGNEKLGGLPTENLAVVVATFEPGKSSGLHSHDCEEFFMILRGYGTATIGDQTFPAEPDTMFYAPKNVKHDFANTGYETMVLVAAFSRSTYNSFS